MSTYDIVEVWKREQREEGIKEGIKDGVQLGFQKAVTRTYKARFGDMPAELAAAIQEMRDEDVLSDVLELIATGSAEEVRERLLAARTR